MLPERIPHPVKDFATAEENRRRICGPRGFCGPFVNGELYDAFPDPMWRGIAECVHCRNTVHRGAEERKRVFAAAGAAAGAATAGAAG